MSFNPLYPQAIGLQWPLSGVGRVEVTDSNALALVVGSDATETIQALRIGHFWPDSVGQSRWLHADIYDITDAGVGDEVQRATYWPHNSYAAVPPTGTLPYGWFYTNDGGSTYSTPLAGPSSGHAANTIAELLYPDQTDWIGYQTDLGIYPWPTGMTHHAWLEVGFDTGGFPSGMRPLAVTFAVRAKNATQEANPIYGSLALWMRYLAGAGSPKSLMGGIALPVDPAPNSTGQGAIGWPLSYLGPFYVNPLTGLPWTRTDIVNFSVPNANTLMLATFASFGFFNITEAQMIVDYIPEKRVAWAAKYVAPLTTDNLDHMRVGSDAALTCGHTENNYADGWNKVTGKLYMIVFRRLPVTYERSGYPIRNPQMRYLTAGEPSPHRGMAEHWSMTVEPSGRLAAWGDKPFPYRSTPLWLHKAGGTTISNDSMPYRDIEMVEITGEVTQEVITVPADRTFTAVRVTCGYLVDEPPTFSSLSVSVVDLATGFWVDGHAPAFINVPALAAAPNQSTWVDGEGRQFRTADVTMQFQTPAALLAGETYAVTFESVGGGGALWFVPGAHVQLPPGLTGPDLSVIGEGTTLVTAPAGDPAIKTDMTETLLDQPDPVTGLTHNILNYSMPYDDTYCPVGGMPSVELSWEPTTLVEQFGHYEVTRSEPGGTVVIARIYDEAATAFEDYEMPRNWPYLSYGVTVVRRDGGVSMTTHTAMFTVGQVNGTIQIASNLWAKTLAYTKIDARDTWNFLTTQAYEFQELHGRDYAVALRQTEQRGTTWSASLVVYSGKGTRSRGGGYEPSGPDVKGRAVFDELREFIENPEIPYFAVCDWLGNTIYGTVMLGAATGDQVADLYIAQVNVRETTGKPQPLKLTLVSIDVEAMAAAGGTPPTISVLDEVATLEEPPVAFGRPRPGGLMGSGAPGAGQRP